MPAMTSARQRVLGRVALIGLGAILILLPVLGLWGAVTARQAGAAAKHATDVFDTLGTARVSVAEEESLERKYRLEPSQEVRAKHSAAATAMVTALERARGLNVDGGFLDDVLTVHRQYLAAIATMFAAIDANDTPRANEIDGAEVDPTFDAIEARVYAAANESRTAALRQLDALTSIQTEVLVAVPIVFAVGAALVILFGWILRSYNRSTEQGMLREVAITRDRELRFRSLVQNAADVILICDMAGSVTYQSPAAETDWGYGGDRLRGLAILSLVYPDDQPALQELWDQLTDSTRTPAAGKTRSTELKLRDGTGEWRPAHLFLTNLLHESAVGGVVVTVRDISERKAFEQQLTRQAFHDSLTGLPNRLLFRDRLHQALVRAKRRGSQIAVLFIDVDNFKLVNDGLGHPIGDELLIEVAARLRSCVRAEDTVARLGGDEFVVVLEHPTSAPYALSVAEEIERRFDRAFTLKGRSLIVTTSIGIALGDASDEQGKDLLRNADVAMYRAKSDGKGRHILFEASMHIDALARLELENELRHAIANRELCIHYQPIMAMPSARIVEVEALVRWQHPTRGLVAPGEFISVAEDTGLILPLGQWVLEQACRQVAAWQAEFPLDPPLVLSVNLSPRQFQQSDLVAVMARVVSDTGLAPGCLKLEITEGAIMRNVELTIRTLWQLKDLGIKLAIDDFGTGYSSLSYLKNLPLDVLKIDRSFVTGLGHDSEDNAIVQAIISLARSLNLQVTGEGIETGEQAALLSGWGCNLGQGYYYAKPQDEADITSLLRAAEHHRLAADAA
jgi:diguanylate cyclase (GGDEF)-like protein/PAS domain S-box-containing protein